MCHLVLKSTLLIVLLEAAVLAKEPTAPRSQAARQANFQITSYPNGPSANELQGRCERMRIQLRRLWLAADVDDVWVPRCKVVLHPTRSHYLQAVGRDAGQTSGTSLIQFEKGRVVARRLDLLVDQRGEVPALAHELTHVVLADRFGGRQPPRWVDEGVATMADSAAKRKLHHRDCQDALTRGTALRMIDILSLEEFTSPEQVPAFYGQSLSLVHFLVQQDRPGRVLDFAEATMDVGYDRALREHYGIDGVNALERRWRDYLASARQVNSHGSLIASGYLP